MRDDIRGQVPGQMGRDAEDRGRSDRDRSDRDRSDRDSVIVNFSGMRCGRGAVE